MLSRKLQGAGGTIGAGGDPYFDDVSLLLHGDGTNGAQNNTFIDSSSNNFTITRNGNVTQGSFSPFAPTAAYDPAVNGGSGYFDGTGDYLTWSGTTLSGDFTVECWVYKTAVDGSGYTNVFYGTSNQQFAIDNTTAGSINLVLNGGVVIPASGTSVTANNWHHLAWVREGTTCRAYVDGVQQGTGTSSASFALSTIGRYGLGGYEMNGYISNARIISGTCLYPSGTTFTPPTELLTAVSGTKLLLNFTNAGIYDNTGKNNLETVGNAQIDTTTKKYGTGSMEFDGAGDYLIVPSNQDIALGSGDWTIELWIYLTSISGQPFILDQRTADSAAQPCLYSSGNSNGIFSYYVNGADRITATTALSTGQWYHVALCRSSGNTKLFYDGVQTGSTYSDSTSYTSGNLVIGNKARTFNFPLNGFIDDLRITKGVARYTADFTPPTQAFPDK